MCVAQRWKQESESEVERNPERAETKCVLEGCIGKNTGRETGENEVKLGSVRSARSVSEGGEDGGGSSGAEAVEEECEAYTESCEAGGARSRGAC